MMHPVLAARPHVARPFSRIRFMNIDRLLARFSIQTKVVVLVIPLIAGMAGLAAVNLYTGSLL
ncbi:hypothetical protein LL06_13835, partial [Hoeflea sp. BAL378]